MPNGTEKQASSEIAKISEKAAREIGSVLLMKYGWQAPGAANWANGDPADAEIGEIVERAIAESRSQLRQKVVQLASGNMAVAQMIDAEFGKLELGDGEPSPPPDTRPFEAIRNALSKLESQIFRNQNLPEAYRTILKAAYEAVEKLESGAAQEVSPPSPEPICPMCCKPVFTDRAEGDTRELKAALKSSPEPMFIRQIRQAYSMHNPGDMFEVTHSEMGELLEFLNASRAEELKAALRHAICDHVHTSGGNDYILCSDCELEWDYRRTTAKLAVKAEAGKLLG